MDEVSAVNFELTEAQYAANEVGESWVQRFLAALMAALAFLSLLLTPSLYDAVVSNILDKAVDRVEALLRLKRFNHLGGLQLDRDIRDLVSSLAEVTQRSVRDKFARLSQVATLLSCESMAEVQEFFGPDATASASYTWRLSDTQIREVLSQRHDFSQSDIARLVL
jgi:conserved oligomeric Golgi complex subunit 4